MELKLTLSRKYLIVSPHADDEILGCGGLLSKYAEDTDVLVVASLSETRKVERKSLAEKYGIRFLDDDNGHLFADGKVNLIPVSLVADYISKYMKKKVYTDILLPYPSIHQDHQSVYHAGLVAARRFDGSIYEYEYPEGNAFFRRFDPNVYLELSEEEINKKVEMLSCYETQLNKYRDDDAVVALAVTRGYESHTKYAEAYRLLKGRFPQ